MSEKHLLEIKKYNFTDDICDEIKANHFVKACWPLVYILSDEVTRQTYVGETTDALSRLKTHLKHKEKKTLRTAHLIMSDKFNKSAALDIESNLIKYLAGDGKYTLLNGNIGLANHTYYQKKEVYWEIFKSLWSELKNEGIVSASIDTINNSDLFKYSPYKTLTHDQRAGLISIIKALLDTTTNTVLVEGGAGTGKTILATYLFTILHTEIDDLDLTEFEKEDVDFINLVTKLKNSYSAPKTRLVIPMASFRNTISRVFSNIRGLRSSMVIGPAGLASDSFDIVVVDESHRLRKRVNLGAYFGAFDKINKRLGLLKNSGDEFDWVLKQSSKSILFYDANQSIKPSDVDSSKFEALKKNPLTGNIKLKSQLRSKGGNDYVSYIDRLLHSELGSTDIEFTSDEYEFVLYESLDEMISEIKKKNNLFGLSRLAAGFSWAWISNKKGNEEAYDITIGDTKLRWNGTNTDWVNSTNAINEVGCIHTTQGYDLNYAGIIFGNEISYDKHSKEIVIKVENYYDRNGQHKSLSPAELKEYILNIYKTLLLRSIKGTFIYACDSNLHEYLKKHVYTEMIKEVAEGGESKMNESTIVSPYQKDMVSIPLYDSVGCGELMHAETTSDEDVQVPSWLIKAGATYFALRTRGDSMNMLGIEDGDIILCQKNYQAPSGSNAVVLVGDDATLKHIKFEKDGLVLIPKSTNPEHRITKLTQDDEEFKVLGVFVCKIE
jgi:DUF2075 family protein/predicted GIY-YIG superfamily endonuclease